MNKSYKHEDEARIWHLLHKVLTETYCSIANHVIVTLDPSLCCIYEISIIIPCLVSKRSRLILKFVLFVQTITFDILRLAYKGCVSSLLTVLVLWDPYVYVCTLNSGNITSYIDIRITNDKLHFYFFVFIFILLLFKVRA